MFLKKVLLLFSITLIFSAFTVTLAGCDEEYKLSGKTYLQDYPEESSYTAEDQPSVTGIPEDITEWDNVTLPLTVDGTDAGTDTILYSVSLAHYWLIKNQLPTGNYLYIWDAETDESPGGSSSIQMLATAWSQTLVYRFFHRSEFLLAAYRALKANMGVVREVDDPDMGAIAHGGSLQTTCFLLYTLIEVEELTHTTEFGDLREKMSRYIEGQVDQDGCIWNKYPKTGECLDYYSEFANGQTLVALERLYTLTADTKWLDILERAANYYYDYFHSVEDFHSQAYFVAWNVGPMVSLLLERPDPQFEEWIYEMADWMVEDQYQPGDRVDYVGGFKKRSNRPPTWSAASFLEPIIDAYRLAKARNDTERMQRYYDAGRYGIHFLTHLQYRTFNIEELNLANPEKAIGAYHFSHWTEASSISPHYVRTDYMDHFAITILKGVYYLNLPETYLGDGFPSLKKVGE